MAYSLNIVWFYPNHLNLYGDRGNVLVLLQRCQWRNINARVIPLSLGDAFDPHMADLVFMGGGSDGGQKAIYRDLLELKGKKLSAYIRQGGVGLFVCGAYQLLGQYYQSGNGDRIPGLGVFDFYTRHFGDSCPRCVGDVVVKLSRPIYGHDYLIGFENHGGRTYLSTNDLPLGEVLHGIGNNNDDATEGLWVDGVVGTYLHGPVLPRNPHLADWLIYQALRRKYPSISGLASLDDSIGYQAAELIFRRYL